VSRYHVRCSNRACRARRVLSRHPDSYLRLPRCDSCGRSGPGTWTIDPWLTKRNTRLEGCTCAGYAWGGYMSGAMHRRGSLRCWYRADGTRREPGDEDFYDESYEELSEELL